MLQTTHPLMHQAPTTTMAFLHVKEDVDHDNDDDDDDDDGGEWVNDNDDDLNNYCDDAKYA